MVLPPPNAAPQSNLAHVITGSGAPTFTGAPGAHYLDTDADGGIYLCRADGTTWARVDNVDATPVIDGGFAYPSDSDPVVVISHTVTTLQTAPQTADIQIDFAATAGAQRYDIISAFAAPIALPEVLWGVPIVVDAGIGVDWAQHRLTPPAAGIVLQIVMALYTNYNAVHPVLVRAHALGSAPV